MHSVYLVHHDSLENMHRFYKMTVSPGIFGEWSLVREWGRIGSPGTVRKDWFSSPEDAKVAGSKIKTTKEKKGYQVLSSFEDQ
ncbi:MAG: WGR domain-containing protein [Methylobacter sp.]|nr:WGR domain-containing protein [Methylobacter sp.]